MTIEDFNDLIERVYAAAFDYESELTAVYYDALTNAALVAERRFRAETVTAAAWTPPSTDYLAAPLDESTDTAADDILEDAGQAVVALLALLGIGLVTRELLEALLERGRENYADAISREITKVIEESFAASLSAEETAAALRSQISQMSLNTARLIAQTQLTTLANERSLAAANAAFQDRATPVYKTWQTMMDNRVRAAHAATQGQTVPINQPFQVGGFAMMYPGDPSAPLNLVMRCRCRMTYTEALTASAKEDTLMPVDELTAAITITITEVEDDDAEDTVEDDGEESMAWRALLAVEGAPTEDGRMLEPGSTSWRDLPLSLMALDSTGPGGHEGAQVAGRIDNIWRDGNEIWAEGVFDSGEFGRKVRRMVAEQTLRGNSVDLAVTAYEYRDAETGEPVEDTLDALFGDRPVLFVVTEGVIMASTVVPTPAIAAAEIMLASGIIHMSFAASGSTSLPLSDRDDSWDSGRARASLSEGQYPSAHFWRDPEGEPEQIGSYKLPFAEVRNGRLTAVWRGVTAAAQRLSQTDIPEADIAGVQSRISAYYAKARRQYDDDTIEVPWETDGEQITASAAGLAPLRPPAAWYDNPRLDGPTPLTVTDEGRVYGHAALWDTCHIGEPRGPGICVPPPRSGMNYSVFHHGVVTTDEGIDIPCGQITLGTTHASRDLSWADTIRHYEHTGLAVADVAAGEDEHGIYVAGALRPTIPAEKVREMKAGALSGDWRQVISRGLEFLAALVVNVPGFPIPRPEARVVASAAGDEEVLALVAAGIVEPDERIEAEPEPTMTVREYLRARNALT